MHPYKKLLLAYSIAPAKILKSLWMMQKVDDSVRFMPMDVIKPCNFRINFGAFLWGTGR